MEESGSKIEVGSFLAGERQAKGRESSRSTIMFEIRRTKTAIFLFEIKYKKKIDCILFILGHFGIVLLNS